MQNVSTARRDKFHPKNSETTADFRAKIDKLCNNNYDMNDNHLENDRFPNRTDPSILLLFIG